MLNKYKTRKKQSTNRGKEACYRPIIVKMRNWNSVSVVYFVGAHRVERVRSSRVYLEWIKCLEVGAVYFIIYFIYNTVGTSKNLQSRKV